MGSLFLSTESGSTGEMLALRQGGRRPGVTILVSDILTVASLPKLRRVVFSENWRKAPPLESDHLVSGTMEACGR